MTSDKPAAEVQINHDLIETLLNEFVKDLKDETIEFHGAGWDNEIHRLGSEYAVRLPRREAAANLIENEQRWLPELAPILPLPIPAPTHSGKPAFGFPWHWSVVPWLPGVPLAHTPAIDTAILIEQLSAFLNALHVPAPEDAPHNPLRGVPLSERADIVEAHIEQIAPIACAQGIDIDDVRTLWDELLGTPVWGGEPLWLHADLHPLNLLVRGARLSAVIDFGDITAGDPAADLSVAWMLFAAEQDRTAFRKMLTIDGHSVDIHTWNRSRAWALSHAVGCMANSADDPTIRRIGSTTLANVLG
jgi:aminoglycoside phosphotransferase (APT) family kinase protein